MLARAERVCPNATEKQLVPSRAFVKTMLGMGAALVLVCGAKIHANRAKTAPGAYVAGAGIESAPMVEPSDLSVSEESATQLKPVARSGQHPDSPSAEADAVVFNMIALPNRSSRADASAGQHRLASFRVPEVHAAELNAALSVIATATNSLLQTRTQIAAMLMAFRGGEQDYQEKVKEALGLADNRSSIASKKLLSLQALYLDRAQQYAREMASLQIFLTDSLPTIDEKLARKQAAMLHYQNDMGQLAQAVQTIRQQAYASAETQHRLKDELDLARQQVSRSALEELRSASGRAEEQYVNVVALIQGYNTMLQRYGTPVE